MTEDPMESADALRLIIAISLPPYSNPNKALGGQDWGRITKAFIGIPIGLRFGLIEIIKHFRRFATTLPLPLGDWYASEPLLCE